MNKRYRGYIRIILCAIVLMITCVATETTSFAEGKNGWVNGYYYEDGDKQTSTWVKDSSGVYYVSSSGKKVTGWKKINKNYYYFNEAAGGKLRNNRKKTGVRLSKLSDDVITMGIDMSQWQGNVNWKKIKESGVDFVMLRLGYGKGRYGAKSCTMDSKFKSYVKGATAVGIPIGIYFYSYAKTPEQALEEAQFTIENLEGIDVSFPIAYDIEDPAIVSATDTETRTEMAVTYMETVKAAGYTPMFYCNQSWYDNYLDSDKLRDYEFWYARYTYVEPDRNAYNCGMWQATSTQKLNGITENTVDINFLYKDYFNTVQTRNSALKYGWYEENDKLYYYYQGKRLRTEWFTLAGKTYYLADGEAAIGWKSISGERYYFNKKGEMQTGFVEIDDKIYLLDSTGVLQSDTIIPGVTIQEDGSCVIKSGWYKNAKGKSYYRYSSGKIAKNTWITKNGKKYYCDSKGYRVTGFKKINGKKYYFKKDGAMVRNKTIKIKGKKYKFNSKGHLVKKW